jgi:hypothetical protein
MTTVHVFFCGIFAFLICIAGCKSIQVPRDQESQDSNLNSIFSGFSFGNSQKYKLPSGRVVNLSKYVIEPNVQSALEKNPFKIYLGDLKVNEAFQDRLKLMKEFGISEIEVAALVAYSAWSYNYFKKYLDGDEIPTERSLIDASQIEPLFLATVAAFNKLPKNKSTVYFGACLNLNVYLPLLEREKIFNQREKIFNQRNFTSTSRNLEVARHFAACDQSIGMGSFIFTVHDSQLGADFSKVSFVPGEEEILFIPGQPFRVKDINKLPVDRDVEAPQYEVDLIEEK